jgi:hypothetical protein
MASNPLVGTWALIATEWKSADGRHLNPWGEGAIGVLTYDASGNMSAHVMRSDRPAHPAGAPSGIDGAMAAAVAGYIAYFGTYEIEGGVVAHTVIGASLPAWVGTVNRRRFLVEGDTLMLRDDLTTADGVAVAAATIWRRTG